MKIGSLQKNECTKFLSISSPEGHIPSTTTLKKSWNEPFAGRCELGPGNNRSRIISHAKFN